MEFNFKRLFSLVVAIVMVLSMVPFDALHVHAADEPSSQNETTGPKPGDRYEPAFTQSVKDAIQDAKDIQSAAASLPSCRQ